MNALSDPVAFRAGCRPAPAAALRVDTIPARECTGILTAWTDLASRCAVPNVFLNPAFAVPLLQHACAGRAVSLVLVWEENGAASFGKLVGLCAVEGRGIMAGLSIRAFRHPHVTLGAPLLDSQRAVDAFAALAAWLAARFPRAAALVFDNLTAEAASLIEAAVETRTIEVRDRAVLQRDQSAGNLPNLLTGRRRKELTRQRNRLSERGQRCFVSAETPDAVARAGERFLALEHSGWKGERGTALLADARLATFARSMLRAMAEEGTCRIDSLEIDGNPVAMGILLRQGERSFFWKTAFDERFAELSPGVQFAAELTRRQLGDATISVTDSCAVPDHPMIDRLWRDRMRMVDLMVALDMDRLPRALAAEQRRRRLLRWMKRWAGLARRNSLGR